MYVELFFIDNFLMDFLIVRLAAALAGERTRLTRELAFTALSAAAACVSAYGNPLFMSLPARILQLALISGALRGRGIKRRIRASLIVLAATAAVGGCAAALVFFTGGAYKNGVLIGGTGLRRALAGAAAASLLPRAARAIRFKSPPPNRAELSVRHGGREFVFRGIVDTGNSLVDPLTGLPVAVVECKALECEARLPVPVRTAAGRTVLMGLRPERVTVNGEEADCVIALAPRGLADEALIPPALFVPAKK